MLISFAVMFGVQVFTYHERALHFKSEPRCINPNTDLSKFLTTILTVVPRFAFDVGSFFNLDFWINKYIMLERPICEFYNEPFDSVKCERKLIIVHTVIGGLILFQIGESALYLIEPDQFPVLYDDQYQDIKHGAKLLFIGLCFFVIGCLQMSTYNKKLMFYWSRFKIKLISVNLGLFLPFLLCGAFEIVVHVLQPFESFKSDKRYLSAATLLNFVLNYFFVVWFQLGTLVKGYDTFAERKSFKSIDD